MSAPALGRPFNSTRGSWPVSMILGGKAISEGLPKLLGPSFHPDQAPNEDSERQAGDEAAGSGFGALLGPDAAAFLLRGRKTLKTKHKQRVDSMAAANMLFQNRTVYQDWWGPCNRSPTSQNMSTHFGGS